MFSLLSSRDTGLYLITGLECGLDCWTGLMDWITGLNLFISYDLHPIKCRKFGYSECTSFSHCMLGNEQCTMDKLHAWMCIMNSWCTCSELKAPSEFKTASKVQTKGSLLKTNVLPECHGERWCQMLYWLAVTRLCNTLACSKNYAWSARGLGINYCANWPTKLLHLL